MLNKALNAHKHHTNVATTIIMINQGARVSTTYKAGYMALRLEKQTKARSAHKILRTNTGYTKFAHK